MKINPFHYHFSINENNLNMKYFFLLLLFTIFSFSKVFSQLENNKVNKYFLDSAKFYFPDLPNKSDSLLQLIPLPIEGNYDDDFIAEYYFLLARVDKSLLREAASFRNYISAVSYAEKNKNYPLAADASYWLSSRFFSKGKDSIANIYLKKSEKYFKLSNNKDGLLDLFQMAAYQEYVNKNPSLSNQILLEHLDKYKTATDDGYYYVYANFLLSTNYLKLRNLAAARQYHKTLTTLSTDTTVEKASFEYFEASLYLSYVDYFLYKENVDSSLHYLKKINPLRDRLDYNTLSDMYLFYINAYKLAGNIDASLIYVDSLTNLQDEMLKKTTSTNLDINETIIQKEAEITIQQKNKRKYLFIAIILLIALLLLASILFLYRKKMKSEIKDYSSKLTSFDLLNTNQNKLKIKISALEEYIRLLKEDISSITVLNDSNTQKKQINELYKKLNIKINNSLDRKDSHIDLVNKLNADFFVDIKKKHPQLNDGEIVVCYYLFIGLKNNEIATFLNSTLRAVESKRFRIIKKIGLDSSKNTLPEYLSTTFKESVLN